MPSGNQRVVSRDVRIHTADGIALAASEFLRSTCQVVSAVDITVIVASGTSCPRQRYASFARYMAALGCRVLTFDYRGIGDSKLDHSRSRDSRMRDWGEQDLAACIAWARQTRPAGRLFVVGHSVGGQVFAFAGNHAQVDGLLAICAQKGYWRFWDGPRRFVMLGLWCLLPLMVSCFGCLPLRYAGRASNLPAGIALEWGRWGRHAPFVADDGQSMNDRFAAVQVPILAISFSDDRFFAPHRAAQALLAAYSNARVQHWHLPPQALAREAVGHTGFFDAVADTACLWRATLEWMQTEARTAGYAPTPIAPASEPATEPPTEQGMARMATSLSD